jgi:hypothetical protein
MFYADFNFHADLFSNLDTVVNLIFQYKLVWLVISIPASDKLIETGTCFLPVSGDGPYSRSTFVTL